MAGKKPGRKANPRSNAKTIAVRIPPIEYTEYSKFLEYTGGTIAAFTRDALREKFARETGDHPATNQGGAVDPAEALTQPRLKSKPYEYHEGKDDDEQEKT